MDTPPIEGTPHCIPPPLAQLWARGQRGKRIALFLLRRGVQDDANGEDVVDVLEGHPLLLHLGPNARDGLGAPFDFELESLLLECLFDGGREGIDESGPDRLGLPQLLLDLGILVRLPVAQTQVFQLAFDGIQSEAVGQRRVHEIGLAGDF